MAPDQTLDIAADHSLDAEKLRAGVRTFVYLAAGWDHPNTANTDPEVRKDGEEFLRKAVDSVLAHYNPWGRAGRKNEHHVDFKDVHLVQRVLPSVTQVLRELRQGKVDEA